MDKPGFGVVTSVVTALVVLGVIGQRIRPLIPVAVENAMGQERNTFLRAGRFEPIDWHRMEPETFVLARKAGKPVLVFIGSTSSRAARDLDVTFANRDIARLLHRYFICVRIDAAEHPEWANAFSPVSRMRLRFQPDAQLWMLSPFGDPLQFVGKMGGDGRLDVKGLEPLLWDAANQYAQSKSENAPNGGALQRADFDALESLSASGHIKLHEYHTALLSQVDRTNGGFPNGSLRSLNPLAHRFLLLVGDITVAETTLDPVLRSPIVDIVDGGFFDQVTSTDPWNVFLDKHPAEMGEMATTLALASLLIGKPEYRMLALRTLDSIQGPMAMKGFIVSGEAGVVDLKDRSARHSYMPASLGEEFEDADAAWLTSTLGLDLSKNPQAIPYFKDGFDRLDLARLSPLLKEMGQNHSSVKRDPSEIYADVHFTAIARSLETARLINSPHHLKQAIRQLDQTRPTFLLDDDRVRHRRGTDRTGGLGDSLGYADARLQDYLATGRYASLEEGVQVLKRAWKTFRTQSGEWVMVPTSSAKVPNTSFPEIADNFHESTTAKVIRLLCAYGKLLADRDDGVLFTVEAEATARRFGSLAIDGGTFTAGIYGAAASVLDSGYAITVGPYAQVLADQLMQKCPTRLVAPAFGDIRRDLASRGNGIYVIRDRIYGPIDLNTALKLLPSTLNPRE